MFFVLVFEAGEGPDQTPCRITDNGGVHRVEVAACAANGEAEVGDSFHAESDDRSAGAVSTAPFPEAGVGAFQESAVFLDKAAQVGAANLFFSFNNPLDPEGKLADLLLVSFNSLDAGHPRALVVRDAAGPDAAVADLGVEGA